MKHTAGRELSSRAEAGGLCYGLRDMDRLAQRKDTGSHNVLCRQRKRVCGIEVRGEGKPNQAQS